MKNMKFAIRGLFAIFLFVMGFVQTASAAPYAAVVIDARDGRVIYSRNANQPLHPASLTKMMTLYIAFSEIEAGRLSLNQRIPISSNAAAEPPSKIGLKAGSSIELRYLLRAAAIKSANDAATAIGEAIAGDEASFARYMTQVARALGMKNTQFKNAHGLTAQGHYSTASDMALLGRRLVYDFPSYYNVFSREYASTPLGNFRNSNIRFLRDYAGADGIKTGYTRAAGYNLVGSAKRGTVRIIVSMFGGQSSYQRNEQIGALLDLGFKQANRNVRVSNLKKIRLSGPQRSVAAAKPAPKTKPKLAPAAKPAAVATTTVAAAPKPKSGSFAPAKSVVPAARPFGNDIATAKIADEIAKDISKGTSSNSIEVPVSRPSKLNSTKALAKVSSSVTLNRSGLPEEEKSEKPKSPSGKFAVQLAAKPSKTEAESYLIATSLAEEDTLSSAKNAVIAVKLNGTKMYRPRFSGISEKAAYDVCSSIQSRNEQCFVIAPDKS